MTNDEIRREQLKRDMAERLLDIILELTYVNDDNCVIWTGPTLGGYPNLVFHRAIWRQINPHRVNDRTNVVHHKCNRKTCYNLNHLEALTQHENMQQASRDGLLGKKLRARP